MTDFVSRLLGKPLITRGGERIGYVMNVQTDRAVRRIRNLECCDEEEEEFLLPLSAAEAESDAIVVRSSSARPCKNCMPAPLGMTAYSTDGRELGRITDLALDAERRITEVCLSDGSKVDAERLLSVTDAAIIDLSEDFVPKGSGTRTARRIGGAPQPRSPGRRKKAAQAPDIVTGEPEKTTTQKEESALMEKEAAMRAPAENAAAVRGTAAANGEPEEEPALSADENLSAETAAADASESAPFYGGAPRRPARRAGSGLLTGKILPRDLKDVRGNVLARAGTVVSREVIRRAMEHGKLFELTLLCTTDFFRGVY